MSSSRKLLDAYVKRLGTEQREGKHLRVFDFDDTLVRTDAKVRVTNPNGKSIELKPAEFAVYVTQPGDVFGYEEFDLLINPRPVQWTCKILRSAYDHHGPQGVAILSARSIPAPIEEFVSSLGIAGIQIVALNTPAAHAKAEWIDEQIRRRELSSLEYFEDAHKNVVAVSALRDRHPKVEIVIRHVFHAQIATLERHH